MNTIDRAALIESAAKAIHSRRVYMARGVTEQPPPTKREVDDAAAALPVIAAELLAPLRELHHAKAYTCTHLRTPGELGPCCRHEICVACNQMHPCPTVRLLDQIEADAKGGE